MPHLIESEGWSIESFFAQDHRRCDDLWALVEDAAEKDDRTKLRAAWARFHDITRAHLAMEEEVLFPAFEKATGIYNGPTQIMRSEHTQMRAILDAMASSVAKGEVHLLLGYGDTLLMLTQQHNQKEEAMLYPMAQSALAHQEQALEQQLSSYVIA